MDVDRDAGPASGSEGVMDMTDQTTSLRRCIGSARFGIEPHDAPVEEFPKQPSQKDGLGRMCRTHWNEYTAGLARESKARKVAQADERAAANEATEESPSDARPKRKRAAANATPADASV
jgi:hypothetical protein